MTTIDTAARQYLAFLADVGFTKHIGGQIATDALLADCAIGPESTVLDIGCGVGLTSVHVARRFGATTVGVDIWPTMLPPARTRAMRAGVADRAVFATGDIQALPLREGTCDVVLGESVLAFVPDRPLALAECRRVMKPGGRIAFNEGTWLVAPPADTARALSYMGYVLITARKPAT